MIPLTLMLNKQEQLTLTGLFEQMISDFWLRADEEKYLYQFSPENPVF